MKIKITNKIKVTLNKKTLLMFFALVLILMASAFMFFGFDLSQKPGVAGQLQKDTSLEINTKKVEAVDEYKYIGTPIDPKQGVGRTEPF